MLATGNLRMAASAGLPFAAAPLAVFETQEDATQQTSARTCKGFLGQLDFDSLVQILAACVGIPAPPAAAQPGAFSPSASPQEAQSMAIAAKPVEGTKSYVSAATPGAPLPTIAVSDGSTGRCEDRYSWNELRRA